MGDETTVSRVATRLQTNPWLGEQIVGFVGAGKGEQWLGETADLAQLAAQHRADVIWLAPPPHAGTDQLPALLFAPLGKAIIWRILPSHFGRFSDSELALLTPDERELFFGRLQNQIQLPKYRIAMIGSRGIPANYGGVETYVEEVSSQLAASCANVTVYCHRKYVTERGFYRGVRLRFVPTIPGKHLETILHTTLATLDAILRGEDIFHYQALGPTTLAWLPRLLGRKVVATVQGLDWQRQKWGRIAQIYLKVGERTAHLFPQATIVVSQTLEKHYQQQHQTPTIYIPNGFEPPQPRPPRLIKEMGLNGRDYILFVGRLTPEKGCHTLLQAYAQIQTDCHLVLAGSATYNNGYKKKLQELAQNSDKVHFTGFINGDLLRELYTNAYLVVHPSEMEGLSISLLEAISYNNCLLVSDKPENLEAIQGFGYSFRVGDSDHLTEMLQDLLNDPEKVAASRTHLEANQDKFMDWEAVSMATQQVYDSLENGNQGLLGD